MITVSANAPKKLLIVEVSGFLNKEDVAEFEQRKLEAAQSVSYGGTLEYDVLIDTTQCMIQSQDVVTAFQDLMAHAPHKATRIAVIRAGSLARLQLQRILARDDVKIAESRDEAIAWLARAPALD